MQENSGLISGSDGRRYHFTGTDWQGDRTPARGIMVDFEADGNYARSVYIALEGTQTGQKNKIVAGLLAILLGGLGIHKFYLGFTGPGLVYLLVNTVGFAITWMLLFIPNMILGIFALIEGIIYLTKSDGEFERLYVIEKKRWF
jgi:TM2 domain-containing membrane protein YozV